MRIYARFCLIIIITFSAAGARSSSQTPPKAILTDKIVEQSNKAPLPMTNLANDQSAGLEFIVSADVEKFATLNFSANAFYNEIDASNLGYSATNPPSPGTGNWPLTCIYRS